MARNFQTGVVMVAKATWNHNMYLTLAGPIILQESENRIFALICESAQNMLSAETVDYVEVIFGLLIRYKNWQKMQVLQF